MARIVIMMSGGLITDVFSDDPVECEIAVIDYDTQGSDHPTCVPCPSSPEDSMAVSFPVSEPIPPKEYGSDNARDIHAALDLLKE